MVRGIAVQAFLTEYGHSEKLPEFISSARFIDDFKERNRLSSRSVHHKRRPTVDPIQEQEWITLMKDLISPASQRERILNCEETTWRTSPTAMKK
jgi:hypothetical protein